MPKEIIKAYCEERLIIFAGAAISTEGTLPFPVTLYEDVKQSLNIKTNLPFDQMMEKFVYRFGRKKLLKVIFDKIDYIKSFNDIYGFSTEFHRELSKLHYIRNIITTNWDSFFEEYCSAIPVVERYDLKLVELNQRFVYKLHGSINFPRSMIITFHDTLQNKKKLTSGSFFSHLKKMFESNLILFIGYSFRDDDINTLLSRIKKINGYIINKSNVKQKFLSSKKWIKTDANHFIHRLNLELTKKGYLLSENLLNQMYPTLKTTLNIHHNKTSSISHKKQPTILFSLAYQDGLIHAYQRVILKYKTGEYLNPHIHVLFAKYFDIRITKCEQNKFLDVAYIDGYLNGLNSYLTGKKPQSYFYIYDYKKPIKNIKILLKKINSQKIINKNAYKHVLEYSKKIHASIVYQHTPFLF